MDLGPFAVWREAPSIQLCRYTCVERVPLATKWTCTIAGDGEVFTRAQFAQFAMLGYVVSDVVRCVERCGVFVVIVVLA